MYALYQILQLKIFFIYWFSTPQQNMKKTKKNSEKFAYPHPIIKNFHSITQQKLSSGCAAYHNFHRQDPNSIPYKVLRSTHVEPLLGSSFSLLLHPLHPGVEINAYETNHLLKCKKCKAILSSYTLQKLSMFQYKCRFCSTILDNLSGVQGYADTNILDTIIPQNRNTNKIQAEAGRKILFIIQANQLLHTKKVVDQIFQCLKALISQHNEQKLNKIQSAQTSEQQWYQNESNSEQLQILRVGFIFYDDSNNYIINMNTNQLIIINPTEYTCMSEFPLTEQQLLQPLNKIKLQQMEQICIQMMYGSYLIKNSCLLSTMRMCNAVINQWQVECKLFSFSFDVGMTQSKNKTKATKNNQQFIHYSSFIQIYLLNPGLFTYLEDIGFKNNIQRIYQLNKLKPTDIYYNLYHNLTQQIHYNIQISLLTSSLIQVHKNTIRMPIITSNTPIILDFYIPNKIKKQLMSTIDKQNQMSNQCIQIICKFGSFQRIISYLVPKISTKVSNQPFLLNDQAFFYVMMCKMLCDKSILSMKNALRLKSKEIINRIFNMEENQFYIPKNLTHFFMYAFMISQHEVFEKKNANFLVNRHQFMKEGLETIVKIIYPKVYQFYPQLKALKFKSKNFLHNTIRIIDNGVYLAIIVGDQVNHQVLGKVFGVKDIDDALQWKQVPILNTDINRKLHESIKLLRQYNELYYLPIKIMRFDSMEFEQRYGNYFYIDQNHYKFFNACFKG